MSNNPRPISQYTPKGRLITTFPSIKEASRATGLSADRLSANLRGRSRTAGRFIWRTYEVPQLSGEQMPPPSRHITRPVYQYDSSGKLLKAWPSIISAAKSTYIASSAISLAIKMTSKKAGGYLWRSYKVEQLPAEDLPPRHNAHNAKQVSQYTCEGVLIQTFPSIKDAAKEVQTHPNNIASAAHRRSYTAAGFLWRYAEMPQIPAQELSCRQA